MNLMQRWSDANRELKGVSSAYLREATADTEMNLLLDDVGWSRVGQQGGKEINDVRPAQRQATVRRARYFFHEDPICSRSVRIFTSYCVGNGFSLKAKDAATQAVANAFWNEPRNRTVFSISGQQKTSNKLNVDGEVFFALFPPVRDEVGQSVGPTVVRRIGDCLEIVNIITNPDDYEEVWYYHRRWTPMGGKQREVLYPDYRLRQLYPDGNLPPVTAALVKPYGISAGVEVDDSTFIYHAPVNSIGERGVSLLASAMGWSKSHREYLEDRIAINRALAKFSWFRKVRGAAQSVTKFAGNQPTTGVPDKMPYQQTAGSTMTTNDAIDWKPVNAQGGGGSAYMESRTIKLMICTAVGMPEHMLGGDANGNRATATVMERQVQLMFQDYQNVLKEAYEAMFAFDVMEQGYVYDADSVDVTSPSILENDSVAMATAIVQLAQCMPELKVDDFYRKCCESLNIEDIQDILPEIERRAAVMFAKTGTYATNGPSLMGAGPSSQGATNGHTATNGPAGSSGVGQHSKSASATNGSR